MTWQGDNDCTIVEWTANDFRWFDGDDTVGWAYIIPDGCHINTDNAPRVPTRQLTAWLNGEGPPEPIKVKVGDRVQHVRSKEIGEVLGIHGGWAWVKFNVF